ncbi:MAG: cyclase family protein [Gammaproteobacteria bacterium]
MTTWMEHAGRRLRILGDRPVSLAIPLSPGGPQPGHFHAPPADATPLSAGSFVGDTRAGGSCNCETVTVVTHCNGTHTEGIGHVTLDRVPVHGAAMAPLLPAGLVTVTPEDAARSGETADPPPAEGDTMITARVLEAALCAVPDSARRALAALVVRSLPNDPEKTRRDWMAPPIPPYFSLQAMERIVALGVRHLLTDLPSVDRILDQGRLAAHRKFWGLPAGSQDAGEASRPEATITEMIFVPGDLPDGLYALSLQLAPWALDAAPSRPVLYPVEPDA